MTTAGDDDRYARYRQVLAWQAEGVTYAEMSRRLGVSGVRAGQLGQQARRWQQRQRLDALPISEQAKGVLMRAGLQTVGDVAALNEAALLGIAGIGPGTVAMLRAYLSVQGTTNGAEGAERGRGFPLPALPAAPLAGSRPLPHARPLLSTVRCEDGKVMGVD